MTMFVRLHKGQFVDAVVPSSIGVQPSSAPGDAVWELPTDINPGKTITVTQNVQAVDPLTGQPLFNADGTPKWKTTNALDTSGNPIPVIDPATGKPEVDANGKPVYQQVIVTQQVPVTYTLAQNPSIFTPADFAGTTYYVVNSLQHAQYLKRQQITAWLSAQLAQGFDSAATGTTVHYGFDADTQRDMEQAMILAVANKINFPLNWVVPSGAQVTFTTAAQFNQMIADADIFKQGYESKAQAWLAKVTSAQTVADVNAVVVG